MDAIVLRKAGLFEVDGLDDQLFGLVLDVVVDLCATVESVVMVVIAVCFEVMSLTWSRSRLRLRTRQRRAKCVSP